MKKPSIRITLVRKLGSHPCHHGHRIGDSFDFDTQRGLLCPMACHVAFPFVDILRYGGTLPTNDQGEILFACPDVDVLQVFRVEVMPPEGEKGDCQ